jgi:hypothetical protein
LGGTAGTATGGIASGGVSVTGGTSFGGSAAGTPSSGGAVGTGGAAGSSLGGGAGAGAAGDSSGGVAGVMTGGIGGAPDGGTGGSLGGAGAGVGGAGAAGKGGAGAGGGAKGGAGAGGAGNGGKGGAGAGGSGGSSGCSVAPVNPNATPQARNLLCYLYSQYGNHVLSGQQETSWSNPEGDISWYANNGMQAPAVMGGDYLYPSGTSTRAIAYWNAGGITMIRYHMGAPPASDTYENSQGTTNIDNVLREGTTENNSFKSKLDYVAAELQKLENANVAVLWAPFHEVQANGWFWWAKGSGAQFVSLWRYMFDYLQNTKGLNNLVWLMPYSGSPNSAYYPGKAYLDLSGPDTYATNQPFTSLYSNARNIVGTTVPIPLHETGLIPNPDNMFPTAAPWVLFNIWAGYQSDGSHNTLTNIRNVYANSRTVTRNQVPNLR